MKKQLLILFLLLGTALHSASQIRFQKTFATPTGGNGYCVLQTSDGGYCAVGASGTNFNSDVLLIKTDAAGDTLWTRIIGVNGNEEGWFFQQTADDGYIIIGFTTSPSAGGEDIFLIRTDSGGDVLWTKIFGGTLNDRGNCIRQTADGGFIITGFTESFGTGDKDICLIKTDANGDITWNKIIGGLDADIGTSIQLTTDGGYIMTGVTSSFGAGSGDLILIRTDMYGTPIWQKAIGGLNYEYAYSVQQTLDGGYISAGYTQSFGAGGDDMYLVKTDSTGATMWSKTFGGQDNDRARSFQPTSDGGYILTGWSYSFGSGDADVALIKTDAFGDIDWSYKFGGLIDDQARYVELTNDGGYIITGGTLSFSTSSYDLYVVKVDSVGASGCAQASQPYNVFAPSDQNADWAIIQTSNPLTVTPSIPNVGIGVGLVGICTNVGVDEMQAVNSFTVYPNPSTGDFVISLNENPTNGTVEIINAIGEIVYSKSIFNESEVNISSENINSGIYFVKIFDGRNSFSRKIVVED